MAVIGKINTLSVLKSSDFGLFLDGDELGEILLPKRYVDKNLNPGDQVDVFIMLDSEDRLTATTDNRGLWLMNLLTCAWYPSLESELFWTGACRRIYLFRSGSRK